MKPVLLLIPGMLNTAAVWRPVAALLEDRFEVRIAEVQTQDSIAAMARDAWARVADVPAHVPLVLCGFSMGGYISFEILRQAPERVRKLGLLDTTASPDSAESTANRRREPASHRASPMTATG